MGTMTMWYEKCPKCGKEMDCASQPTSLLWSVHCAKCGYDDGRNYTEEETGTIILK